MSDRQYQNGPVGMNDWVAEIKSDPMYGIDSKIVDRIKQLIAEVERLQARRVPMDEQDKKANQIMRDAVKNMQKQVESHTEERDELKVLYENNKTNRWQNFDLAQERRLKIEKLEAENVKLRERVGAFEKAGWTVGKCVVCNDPDVLIWLPTRVCCQCGETK